MKHNKKHVDPARLRALHAQGLTDGAMARELGISEHVVRLRREALHLPSRRAPSTRVKITRDEMAAHVAAGRSDAAIATLLGCSETTVRHRREAMELPAGGGRTYKRRETEPTETDGDPFACVNSADAALAEAMAGRRYGIPRAIPASAMPKPLPRPGDQFSAYGGSARMCAELGKGT